MKCLGSTVPSYPLTNYILSFWLLFLLSTFFVVPHHLLCSFSFFHRFHEHTYEKSKNIIVSFTLSLVLSMFLVLQRSLHLCSILNGFFSFAGKREYKVMLYMVLLQYDNATVLKKYIVMCFLIAILLLSQIFICHASD